MNIRRRFLSILLVVLFVITPIFADTDWVENKVLGITSHSDIHNTYVSSMTKGHLKNVLPYQVNLEMIVEHKADAMHPLGYSFYIYDNLHRYLPITLKGKAITVSFSNDYGESCFFKMDKSFKENLIQLDDMHSLAVTELMTRSRHLYIEVKDGKNTYNFRVDTSSFNKAVAELLLDDGNTEEDVRTLLTKERDIADFVSRNMKYVVNTPGASLKNLESLLYFLMDYADHDLIEASAKVLWERDYEDWIEYFGSGDTEKAHDVLWFIGISKRVAPPKELDEEIILGLADVPGTTKEEVVEEVEEIREEEVVVPSVIVEEAIPEEIIEEETVYPPKTFYMGLKTYGMGVNILIDNPEDKTIEFPLGASLDFNFFGKNNGASIELGYIYNTKFGVKQHNLEPGIYYVYRNFKFNGKTEIDFKVGAIANFNFFDYPGITMAFGGRMGLDLNFFMSEHSFFTMGLHVRALSPTFASYDGHFMTYDPTVNIDCELGAGFGIAF